MPGDVSMHASPRPSSLPPFKRLSRLSFVMPLPADAISFPLVQILLLRIHGRAPAPLRFIHRSASSLWIGGADGRSWAGLLPKYPRESHDVPMPSTHFPPLESVMFGSPRSASGVFFCFFLILGCWSVFSLNWADPAPLCLDPTSFSSLPI